MDKNSLMYALGIIGEIAKENKYEERIDFHMSRGKVVCDLDSDLFNEWFNEESYGYFANVKHDNLIITKHEYTEQEQIMQGIESLFLLKELGITQEQLDPIFFTLAEKYEDKDTVRDLKKELEVC